MVSYHITDEGPRRCSTTPERCAYGDKGNLPHYADLAEARTAYERNLEAIHGAVPEANSREQRATAVGKLSEFQNWAEIAYRGTSSRTANTRALLLSYSKEQREAIELYVDGESFGPMREAWKRGEEYALSDGSDAFGHLNGLLEDSRIVGDTQAYRSLRMDNQTADSLAPGSVIEGQFYTSATTDLKSAKSYGLYGQRRKKGETDVVLQIKVAEGTRAIPGAEGLEELIFSPDAKLHVEKKMIAADGKIYLFVALEDGEI